MKRKIKIEPSEIFCEYRQASDYKAGIGDRGIYEQARINERFFAGDQWYGAKCGNTKPLARRNIIKRIGEYKMASVGAAPIAVNYSADGIPNNAAINEEKEAFQQKIMDGSIPQGRPAAAEISVITSAMSNYFSMTAERLKFNKAKDQLLKNAYISGTAILYTYWDSDIMTGLYADDEQTSPIKGDICCEVLDVENVCFGEPNNDDVQSQPYIIIAQRTDCEAVRREAEKYGASRETIRNIKPDGAGYYFENAGDRGEIEPTDSNRVTVLTKLYKEFLKEGGCTIKAVKVTETAVVRDEWDMGLSLYPVAVFCWESRRSCIYGDSEITYLIPNQIAINRALTASVWAMMAAGMPKMMVNGDVIPGPVTNNPGEIIRVYGDENAAAGAIRYVMPPNFSAVFQSFVNDLAGNTLADSGANDAVLGNVRPDNAAAIIQLREAALQPLQLYQNRFYDFIEDIARIWADFWLNYYGNRSIKISNAEGTGYMPFNAERYKNLVITARIDVGASTLWSEAVVISTLGNMLQSQLITPVEYLERLPKGIIPDITKLIESRKQQENMNSMRVQEETDSVKQEDSASYEQQILELLKNNYPEQYEQYAGMPPEQQKQLLASISGRAQAPTEGVEEL